MRFWIATLAFLAANFGVGQGAGELHLALVADVTLPGNATRFDYQSIDSQKHLLFVAHLGDNTIVVFDTKTQRVAATIPNISAVHGVLAVPEIDTLFASATGTNEVVAIDERTLALIARTAAGTYPDGLAYDPRTSHLFVSDEHGDTETVIDARSHRPIATISLGGEVGNTQYDPSSHHMFVNVQTLGQLAEIDPQRNAVIHRHSLTGTGCAGNHGLLIDSRRRRAFVGCEKSNTFLWIDMRDMRPVQAWGIGEGPDVLALDTRSGRLFVASESGTISVFLNKDRVTLLAQSHFAPHAHTVVVNSRTQRVYFPLEDVDGKPVLRIMKERP